MRKFLLSFLVLSCFSFQSLSAAGYIALYSMEVEDQNAFAADMDELMSSDWGKSFPGAVSLVHYTFNGYDDATHAVVINYETEADMAKGTDSFYEPYFGTFLAKTASNVSDVEQSLSMKLISGGESNPENNQVYTVFRMQVEDPASYAKAYMKVTEAQQEAGNMDGAYGLRAQVAGSVNYYTHYAFIGASSMQSAIEGMETLYSSDSFATFQKEVDGNRKLMNTSMLKVLKVYNTN
tara:strand:+ start:130 stop:837 length:708 start_codon:yes stop_codon:yes gene_type:complete